MNLEDSIGSDIKVIREILFGEYLKSITQEIASIKDEIAQLRNDDRNLQKSLKTEEAARREADGRLQQEELQQREELDKRLSERIEAENQERRQTFSDNNARVDTNFTRLQNEIEAMFSEHHALHQDLIRSLATALLKYSEKRLPELEETAAAHD